MDSFFSIERFFDNIPMILRSISVTFKIVLVATLFGVVLGLLIAIIRIKRIIILNILSKIYVSFMRGTPMLAQMLLVFYGLPIIVQGVFGINMNRIDKIYFVYIAYSLNQGAFLSEIFKSSILAIPKGQWEAGHSVGFTSGQTFKRIILPQAVRIAIPSFGSDLISLFQSTSLAFLIGVIDVMGRAKAIGSATKHAIEAYIFVALLFVFISLILKGIFGNIEEKLNLNR